jgi:hypothetical protein
MELGRGRWVVGDAHIGRRGVDRHESRDEQKTQHRERQNRKETQRGTSGGPSGLLSSPYKMLSAPGLVETWTKGLGPVFFSMTDAIQESVKERLKD